MLDKIIKKLSTCPECHHDSIDGVPGCECKDKHCVCNPDNWNWSK